MIRKAPRSLIKALRKDKGNHQIDHEGDSDDQADGLTDTHSRSTPLATSRRSPKRARTSTTSRASAMAEHSKC